MTPVFSRYSDAARWFSSAVGEFYRSLAGLIKEKRLADVLNLRDRAFQVKGFRKHNFEDLQAVCQPCLQIDPNQTEDHTF